MTEETINSLLDSCSMGEIVPPYDFDIFNRGQLLKAMQEAVERGSIGFAEWVDYKAVRNGDHHWTIGSGNEMRRYTSEQLYDLYIKSL